MPIQPTERPTGATPGEQLAIVVVALVAMALLMLASYFYPYPSGERPSIWSLLLFWGREALIFATAILVMVIAAAVWIWTRICRFFGARSGSVPVRVLRSKRKDESAP